MPSASLAVSVTVVVPLMGMVEDDKETSEVTRLAGPGVIVTEGKVEVTGCPPIDAVMARVQAVVPVLDVDDEQALSERILKEEHRIYSLAVKIVLEGNYRIEGRRVLLTTAERAK